MTKKLALLFVCCTFLGACKTTDKTIQTSKPTDAEITCAEIRAEMKEMDEIISEVKGDETAAHVSKAGTAIAGHGATLSGIPYLGAALHHGGSLANMGAAERKELARKAEMRKNTLNGLAIGKRCNIEDQ